MSLEVSARDVVTHIMHSSLYVSGTFGVLVVFSHCERTLRVTEEWNAQWGVGMITIELMNDLTRIAGALHRVCQCIIFRFIT